jgi:hypothetical protein
MNNVFVSSLLFWPLVVLVCAGVNMLVTRTFSWSELVFDYLIGVAMGICFSAGTRADAAGVEHFLLLFSHGLFGLAWVASDEFRSSIGDAQTFAWMLAGVRIGATLWAACWDHLSVKLGAQLGWKQTLLSLLLFPSKLPFALLTTGVGLAIWLVGLANAVAGGGKVGLAGGVFFAEWRPAAGSHYATTLGGVINTWLGPTPFKHELYHSRQYIYMGDWLTPFWVLGTLWGLASAAIARLPVGSSFAFGADSAREIGNPVEVAAYHTTS